MNGTSTQSLYDGLNPVQEIGATATTNLLTGPGIDEYLTRAEAAATRSLLTDALGSTIVLSDETGTVQSQYTYEPFGATTIVGADANPFQYTGRENDNTGLYYYRARYYHPRFQRFINGDPIGFGGGDANLYAYVGNSPLNSRDSEGMAISEAFQQQYRDCTSSMSAGVEALVGRKPTSWLGSLAPALACDPSIGMMSVAGLASGASRGALYLLANWHRSTIFSVSGSVFYHWSKHAARYGRSASQYTQDALAFFQKNQHLAKPVILQDGSPGLIIRTRGGGPGGFFTPSGRVVSFWYR